MRRFGLKLKNYANTSISVEKKNTFFQVNFFDQGLKDITKTLIDQHKHGKHLGKLESYSFI